RVALADDVHGAVHDLLGDRLLAAVHHHVDEARDGFATVLGIGQHRALRGVSFTRHCSRAFSVSVRRAGKGLDQPFGRLAPYLERACLRLATPAASSEPRTVW